MAPPSTPTTDSGRTAIDVALACAREAGAFALRNFRTPQDVTIKGRGNLVTETDFAVEALIKETLMRAFPEHAILSEETASDTSEDGWVWVVDPVDGTRNFVSGIPIWCINIALCHDGEPVVAVTHDPNRAESFVAELGHGMTVNGEPAQASANAEIATSVVGVDLGYDEANARALLELVHRVFDTVDCVRIPGSAALGLAYAAAGRYDIFLHRTLCPWDIAAGILLVREAGGTITDGESGPVGIRSRSVIAGGAEVHADFLRWQREHVPVEA